MKIIFAPDSFKESISAVEAAQIMAASAARVLPGSEMIQLPLSDGGEGFISVLTGALGGSIKEVRVKGPAGKPINSYWGLLADNTTAVIEVAAASGFTQVSKNEMNPLITTTFGVGELIREALNHGCSKIIIGAGGSATNDGGSGAVEALGVKFLDKFKKSIALGGGSLDQLAEIDITKLDPRINKAEVIVACDVNNPLTGPQGASYIFAPQKGSSPVQVKELERCLKHYAAVIVKQTGKEVEQLPGSGAAGGLGAGLAAFLNARLTSGIELVMDLLGFNHFLNSADLLVTGEGRLDEQSTLGKVPVGVAHRARRSGVPVVVMAGSVPADNRHNLYEQGITAVFSITAGPLTLNKSIENTALLLSLAVENVIRLWSTALVKAP